MMAPAPKVAPRARDAGFTLLELLVGLALAALLMAAVPSAIRLSARALDRAEALSNEAADRAALTFIAERLAETMALYERGPDGRLKVAFTGDAHAIGFVTATVMDPRDDPAGGLFLIELAHQAPTSQAVLRWQPFRPGLTTPASAGPRERALLAQVATLSFRYFGSVSPRVAPSWSDTWSVTAAIPDLVEMQVTRSRNFSAPLTLRVALRLRQNR